MAALGGGSDRGIRNRQMSRASQRNELELFAHWRVLYQHF
jgi:hypothetical protein